MFSTIRNKFRPLSLSLSLPLPSYLHNYTSLSEYIIKTTHKSVEKDCENYIFNKKMREFIDNDNDNDNDNKNNASLTKLYNNINPYGFCLFSVSIGLYSFLYFYRFKK